MMMMMKMINYDIYFIEYQFASPKSWLGFPMENRNVGEKNSWQNIVDVENVDEEGKEDDDDDDKREIKNIRKTQTNKKRKK